MNIFFLYIFSSWADVFFSACAPWQFNYKCLTMVPSSARNCLHTLATWGRALSCTRRNPETGHAKWLCRQHNVPHRGLSPDSRPFHICCMCSDGVYDLWIAVVHYQILVVHGKRQPTYSAGKWARVHCRIHPCGVCFGLSAQKHSYQWPAVGHFVGLW